MTAPARRALAWIVAGLGLGLLYRLVYLRDLVGELRGDSAVVALMASHILAGKHYIFYWGQDYMGSLEAYTAAALAGLVGLGDGTVMGAPLLYALLYVLTFYPLGRLLYGEAVGRAALALAALCPPLLAVWSVAPRGGYANALLFGQLALLLAVTLARDRPARWGTARAAALGFVAGLGVWTSFLVVTFLLPAGLVLLARDPRAPARRHFWIALAAFAAGSAPLWVHVVRHDADPFSLVTVAGAGASPAANLAGLVAEHGPRLLGIREVEGEGRIVWGPLGYAAGAVLLAGVLVEAGLARRGLAALVRGRAGPPGGEVCVLLLAVVCGAFLFTRYGSWDTPRFLLPAYGALFPLLGAALVRLGRRSRPAAVAAAVLVLAVWGRGAFGLHDELRLPLPNEARLQGVIEFLESRGVRHGYADYDEALAITWRTRERIVLADWKEARYPVHELADWRPEVIVVAGRSRYLEAALDEVGLDYARQGLPGYTVFHDLRARHPTGGPLPRRRWQVRASRGEASAPLAIDGNPGTRWTTARPQAPGTTFDVEFEGVERVAGVRLHSGAFTHDVPRGLRIEARGADGGWHPVGEVRTPYPGLAIARGRVELRPGAVLFVSFAARPATALRLVTTASHPVFDWSIAELEILGEAGGGEAR